MNSFENIPDEIILNLCNIMSIESLGRFRTTNWKIYNICKETLLEKIMNDILSEDNELYEFNGSNGDIVQLSAVTRKGIFAALEPKSRVSFLRLDIDQLEKGSSWPFPNIKYKIFHTHLTNEPIRSVRNFPVGISFLKELVITLLDNGYTYNG